MNMPGFTADTSLYKAGRSYRISATGSASTSQVVPQLVKCRTGRACVTRCGPTGCYEACVGFPDCWDAPADV